MNIFNIGKANERISALETELAKAKEEAKQAQDSLAENSKQVEQAAEVLKKERDDFKAKFDAESQAHTATKANLTKAESDLKAAKDEVAALPKEIEEAASKKAVDITSAQGIPPINQTPSATPAAPQKTELKGIEKVKAAFAAQLKPAATL